MKNILNRKYINRFLALFLTVSVIASNFTGSAFASSETQQSGSTEIVGELTGNEFNGSELNENELRGTVSGSDGLNITASEAEETENTVSGGDAGNILSAVGTAVKRLLMINAAATSDTPTEVTFDLAKGSVSFTQSTVDGNPIVSYTGKAADGTDIIGIHVAGTIYTVMQSDSGTTTHNVISVGTPAVAITQELEIHLAGVNIDAPGSTAADVNAGKHSAAVYINTGADNTVYLVLDNGTQNYAVAYGKIFKSGSTMYASSLWFGHAAIEKEVTALNASADGTLVITCEEGLKAYKEDEKTGHECSENGSCGVLKATSKGDWGFYKDGGISKTRVSAAAAIGSKADVSEFSHNETNINNAKAKGTLHNLIIAGGVIDAIGSRGNTNSVSGVTVYLGGSAAIGVGAGMQQYSISYDLKNMRITGGYIKATRGDGSAACIGGGYHAGYVNVDIYGGTIFAKDKLTATSDPVRGAGIGGGGGGAESNATKGATVNIFGGNITAYSEFGAAIGAGGGGNAGSAQPAIVNISGGVINATTTAGNAANIGAGAGAAIGTGGSLGKGIGGAATVTISGGAINASSDKGADIGGGGTNSTSNNAGGAATVNISGGNITANKGGIGGGKANAGNGGDATVTITGGAITGYAIGGGDSNSGNGGKATVTIGGTANVSLTDIIGGGNSASGNGGDASVMVNGGTLVSKAIGGGNTSSTTKSGGNITGSSGNPGIHITGGTIQTGSIGGGSNGSGAVGYASAKIEGGTVRGQFVMKASAQGKCTFTMTGGTIRDTNTLDTNYTHSQTNGGAVYMDDPDGIAQISGGVIENCSAENGGAVYMTAGTFTMSGNGLIQNCSATVDGGAVYMTKGIFSLQGGSISGNKAENGRGGAVYLGGSGEVNVSGGTIGSETLSNVAKQGGGAYVNNGSVSMTGGSLMNNEATADGGGVYINGGNFTMNGANALINGNKAVNGAGVYLVGGKPLLQNGTLSENAASNNGGGIYIDKQIVTLKPLDDVNITGNTAGNYGAGICISGTAGAAVPDAGFLVDKTSAGMVNITGNIADETKGSGGGVCIDNGYFKVDSDKITLTGNRAYNGGGVAVIDGNFTLSASAISGNTAANLGGGVMVDGGNATFSGGIIKSGAEVITTDHGQLLNNTAQKGGGGIAVKNGNVVMNAGEIIGNTVVNGDGGGIYVESSGKDVSVMVYSGTISGNKAKGGNGGAVSVVGQEGATDNITVQLGVNHEHALVTGGFTPFEHSENGVTYYHTTCPVINSNTADEAGGACYITGSDTTNLNIYCMVETNNDAYGDVDINDVHLSEFMMVAGGRVIISASTLDTGGSINPGTSGYGLSVITGTIHITGGHLDLYGTMLNPDISNRITVDIRQGQGEFEDHRPSKGYSKLLYDENFKDPVTGKVDATLTAYQISHDSEVIISQNLYIHDGYTIEGWYTKPDSKEEGGVWYDAGSVYKFYQEGTADSEIDTTLKYHVGDLTLYAIWEVHGYTVVFHPNTADPHKGEMNNQSFTYDQVQNLTKNAYKWPGHKFISWNTAVNGSGTGYADEQEVSMLTGENGAVVNLYAQWVECDHPAKTGADTWGAIYTVEEVDADEKNIVKSCDCGYKAKIVFSADGGKYNGTTKYPAVLDCEDSEWVLNEADIDYDAVKIDDLSVPLVDSDTESQIPVSDPDTINAGYYTAGIQLDKTTGQKPAVGAAPENIITVEINYTIHKAEQPAPNQKPEFEPKDESEGNTKLLVTLLGKSALETEPEYAMEFYENGVLRRDEWIDNESKKEDGKLVFTVQATYTNYSIYARYKGTDNYKNSSETKSNSVFYYTGNTDIYVDAEEGIKGILKKIEGGVELQVTALDGFYITNHIGTAGDGMPLSGIHFDLDKKDGTLSSDKLKLDNVDVDSVISPLQAKNYVITNIPTEHIITITLRGARVIPTINSIVQSGQVYEEVTGGSASFSYDSAYTVAYEVIGYDTADYEVPVLTFDRLLPAGTNLIMKDMVHNTYWRCDTSGKEVDGKTSITLSEFTKMGSEGVHYAIETPDGGPTRSDLKLQFVVDFSEETAAAGDVVSALKIENLKTGSENVSNAPVLTDNAVYPEISATAFSVTSTFSLGVKSNTELGAELTYGYGPEVSASKWNNRQEVLILTVDPNTPLPKDAIIYGKVNEYWNYYHRIVTGNTVQFVIPLGDLTVGASDVTMQLQSSMFPSTTATYKMTAQLGMAMSIAEESGINAQLQGDPVAVTFTNTAFEPAVSIKWNGSSNTPVGISEKRVFVNTDMIPLLIDYKALPDENLYEIDTAVLQKVETETGAVQYHDTGVRPRLEIFGETEDENELYINAKTHVELTSLVPGSYCFMVTVTRHGYTILQTPYYFIMEEATKDCEKEETGDDGTGVITN